MNPGAVARARGLAAGLLARDDLTALAAEPDLAALARALASRGLCRAEPARADAIDQDLRRVRGARFARLARWCDAPLAEVLYGDEDRRTVRMLLRAAAAGVEPARAGLVPTPSLPEAALSALAEQRTPRDLAAQLALWGHPYADALLAASTAPRHRAPPALAALEGALHRAWAARARVAARRVDRFAVEHVRWAIDVENLLSLVVDAGQPAAARDPRAWLPGGDRPTADAYAAALADPAQLADLGVAVGDAGLEARALVERMRVLARIAREHPLSSAPALALALRVRAEAIDVGALVWGHPLGRRPTGWVTP